MKILCHVGPWCIQQYTAIAKAVDSEANIILASGFQGIDETGLAKNYYQNVKSKGQIDKELDSDDFIKRCRLLRSLCQHDALNHLHAMKKAVSVMFDAHKPDIVISKVVDQYLIDLIRYECKQRGIPFFGLVVSFINGYFRVTSRGEYTKVREVNQEEVDLIVKQLEDISYVPKFVSIAKQQGVSLRLISKRLFSNWLRIPYFLLKRYLTGEKYNYHYWASQKSAMQNFHFFPRFYLGSKDWKKRVANIGAPVIYLPLQMYPEATIEYWCEDLGVIQYHKELIKIITAFAPNFQFIIKEHPNVLGLRTPKIYRQLSKLKNVSIIPVSENSNSIIEYSDAVMVWTGTVGFEAALRGKPVLTVCCPYYASGPQFKSVNADTAPREITEFIEERSKTLSSDEKTELVAHLLSGLVPGHYINNASWRSSNFQDKKDAKVIGDFIKAMYSVGGYKFN